MGPLKRPSGEPSFLDATYDLVFLDPPYRSHLAPGLIEALSVSKRLKPGALIVLETGKTAETRQVLRLQLIETRIYGDTKLSIYKKKDPS